MGEVGEPRPKVEELPYKQLQAELKLLGISAKGSTEALQERLANAWHQPLETPGESKRSTRTARTPKSPRTARKTRQPRAEPEDEAEPAETAQPVTTRGSPSHRTREQTQRNSAVKQEASPDEDVNQLEGVQAETTGTPVELVKRYARRSAAGLQKSVEDFQREVSKRRLGWIWPALATLLLALLIGSQWRHTAYWQRQLSSQTEKLQQSVAALYDSSQLQAASLGRNVQSGLSQVQDGLLSGASTVSRSASGAWDAGSELTNSALVRAVQYLPSTKKLRAQLPTSACCARLDASELDPLLPNDPVWDGVRISLHEAWSGLKDDPLKGSTVLLAGRSRNDLRVAAVAIERAVPADCKHCYLHIKADSKLTAGGLDAAGNLQATLAAHLKACPQAIVHFEAVNSLHIDVLPVLFSALSEQGSLLSDGQQIPAHRAIYIGSTIVPAKILKATNEQEFKAAVKKDLVFQLGLTATASQGTIPEAFRRNLLLKKPYRGPDSAYAVFNILFLFFNVIATAPFTHSPSISSEGL